MLGLRENPDRMDYLGFKVPESKGLVYIVGGAFAGIAGSIYALFQNLISPDAINLVTAFTPVLMAMMGGLGTFVGPILGAGIFQAVEEIARHYTNQVELVMGLMLIIVVLAAPTGVVGLYRDLKVRWHTSHT
jgi:branched-chain amino acid transport system permease protein